MMKSMHIKLQTPYSLRWFLFYATTLLAVKASTTTSFLSAPPSHNILGKKRRPRNGMHYFMAPNSRRRIFRDSCLQQSPFDTECNDEDPPLLLKGASAAANEQVESDTTRNERTLGILVLLTVPLAWGTYTPVVKYMYDRMEPSVPGFVFSAGYYLVAAGVLSTLNWWTRRGEFTDDEMIEEEDTNASTLGGLELGSYLFLGNGFQVVGLQTVPADRAAFLVQLTTVMVPLVSAWVSGRGLASVPLFTWLACVIAFLGVIIMGMDDSGQHAQMISSEHFTWDRFLSSIHVSQGDGFIILAALAYTMHVVRLGVYAPKTRPLTLAMSKARWEATFSVVLVVILANSANRSTMPDFIEQMGKEIIIYFKTIQEFVANTGNSIESSSFQTFVAAILWTGMITSAYTIYAQSFGQRRINPVDSNLIYTTQPLFSSLFAYWVLDEQLGMSGWVGAALIGVALSLVVFSLKEDEQSIERNGI